MRAFHHEAVFYRDDDEYLAGTMPHIRAALAADGAALVSVPNAKRELLEQALGADAERVVFLDMEEVGPNPACILPVWRDFLSQAGSGPVIGVGEPVWPGRSDAELVECSRHESLLNLAFDGGRAWRLLCPYDATALDADVLEDACRNHPRLARGGESWASDEYTGPRAALARPDSLPAPADRTIELQFGAGQLALVRQFVADAAGRAGIAGDRLEDLVLAVNELVANTVRHGGGTGVLRMWADEDTFVCEVADHGRISDPFAGRSRPSRRRESGRGLWMVNHLCDLVQVRSTKEGSVVRLHMSLA
ncbi:MAG TPA: sensor histidine kinase [Solirubrobacteraceae bacterium]|nr:sensor histidine kinase [Solirubrobacteraceae bacterium]